MAGPYEFFGEHFDGVRCAATRTPFRTCVDGRWEPCDIGQLSDGCERGLDDFAARTRLPAGILERLATTGALDALGTGHRRTALWRAGTAPGRSHQPPLPGFAAPETAGRTPAVRVLRYYGAVQGCTRQESRLVRPPHHRIHFAPPRDASDPGAGQRRRTPPPPFGAPLSRSC